MARRSEAVQNVGQVYTFPSARRADAGIDQTGDGLLLGTVLVIASGRLDLSLTGPHRINQRLACWLAPDGLQRRRPHGDVMKKTILAAALVLAFGAAQAHAGNLVLNGSFKSRFSNWTLGGTSTDTYPPVVINYNSATPYPTGAFGEAVPNNNAPTNSTDIVGNHAAYFVATFATNRAEAEHRHRESGHLPGRVQRVRARQRVQKYFRRKVLGRRHRAVGELLRPSRPRDHVAGVCRIADLVAGTYEVEFVFNTAGVPAAISSSIRSTSSKNPHVPTPDAGSTALLFATGLAGVAGVARRLRRRA